MSDWSETKTLLHELELLFTRDDDLKDIMDIKKMEKEIEIQQTHKLKDAKEIIKSMTTHLASKETEIVAPSHVLFLFMSISSLIVSHFTVAIFRMLTMKI